ncbi:MAG TPA: hypothetical protein VE934_02350 [Polaromonas sp.]|uniref:hypothetical protein n=1 Tax=Polaromonas sp. TaxID=1869339 RepID=UPI002D403B17|nr:hypothetical protein [Polaromonas sp.]HYW55775.1 hypothetical protein [Polaromonas sp.]
MSPSPHLRAAIQAAPPFLPPRPVRTLVWPFIIGRKPAAVCPIRARAAAVIATTARHWLSSVES